MIEDENIAQSTAPETAWDAPSPGSAVATPTQALFVDIDGFEGPLDLLLALARTHKVDLMRISMLSLADQYLNFIADLRQRNLELAADYLVMAAWLAYLKSRLLLPREQGADDQPDAEELAQRLSFRLMRLDAMRTAAAQLMNRNRLGRDVFGRGMPEPTKFRRETVWTAEVIDLLKAYADSRLRTTKRQHVVVARKVWSIKDARRRLEVLVGTAVGGWIQLDMFLEQYLQEPGETRTVLAASFGASLEMAREGLVELRQDTAFGPLHMRRKESASEEKSASEETSA